MKVGIVGAGLAGLCAARSLLAAGIAAHDITVFERRASAGLETSFANGALLHPSAVDPWNSPGILGVLWRSLGRDDAAVLLRLRALPSLLGWGLRFVRESSPERHRAHTLANVALPLASVRLMDRYRTDGLEWCSAPCGSLAIYRDAASLAHAVQQVRALRAHGLESRALSRDEVVALEPALAPIAADLHGGVHHLGDETGDAQRFCHGLAQWLAAQGVQMAFATDVQALLGHGQGVSGLRLASGAEHRFDAVVLAAASHSVALAAPLGLAVPVRPVKGYSITLPLNQTPAAAVPHTPVIDSALHIALTPLHSHDGARLRVAGTAEFCGFDNHIDPARVANLIAPLKQVYPALGALADSPKRIDWTGLRPMCADGKALIGATRVKGLFFNTGHGQIGWTTAAASGELLAQAVTGQSSADSPGLDGAAFLPVRFGL